ncbi:hypothetical protein PN462_02955 [Spirulina sp. CS-785/01]|uniref:hypothetical protein n=1 Tax=Spirulina sp. CS-785/01 TaxID=3021716 RepID=UPI0023314C15|nr:hypothetical protein [Spirulina sp. CS-785/01]MDB9312046.1 hypothetical protein [Spirulina sp. CS-785/01]
MNSEKSLLPPEIWLSLITPPVLGGIGAIAAITQGLQDLGEVSEEVFRGDRLPLLPFPPDSSYPDSANSESPQ